MALPELPPYIYGREAEPNERVWAEVHVRYAVQKAVEAEREACAQTCEAWAAQHGKDTGECTAIDCDLMATAMDCAAAIRARKEST